MCGHVPAGARVLSVCPGSLMLYLVECEMNKASQTKLRANTWQGYCGALVDQWLAERCDWGGGASGHKTPSAELHADFTAWCARRGIPPVTITNFGRRLADRGILVTKGIGGRKERWPIRFAQAAAPYLHSRGSQA